MRFVTDSWFIFLLMNTILKIFFLYFISSLSGQALIYQSIDANGNIIFSDTPTANQTIVDLTENPVSSFSMRSKTLSTTIALKPSSKTYTQLLLFTENKQNNFYTQDPIKIKMKLEPPLQTGDEIQLWIDHERYGNPTSTLEFDLPADLPRGTHHLQAKVLTPDGEVLIKSNEFILYKHQTSVLNPDIS